MADLPKLKSLFPHASTSFIQLNGGPCGPERQRNPEHVDKGSDKREKANTRRCILSYTIYRRRLLDEENWFTKFFTDALRYCGAIPDDSPEDIELRVRQKKVERKNQEKTLIEVTYP